ncbi:Transmembrane protein [Dirofilaria immitis]
MVQHPAFIIIRRNFNHTNYKYHQINESKLSTLWVACRAIVFGGVIIIFGILMTILGYFDVYLSQETVHNGDDGTDKISTNWTKRYLFKSLQYLGPIAMGIGSFILIIACVITLESRDKNTQIFQSVEEVDPCKKKSLLQRDTVQKRLPMTDEEIREWMPQYKAIPLSRCDSSPIIDKRRKYRSAPCIPQLLLDTVDNRRFYGRYLNNYYCGIFDIENDFVLDGHDYGRVCTSSSKYCSHISPRQNVTVELHNPPSLLLSSAIRSPSLRISPIASAQQNQSLLQRHAPLASLDIEFGTSSSSSSSNTKVPIIDSFLPT